MFLSLCCKYLFCMFGELQADVSWPSFNCPDGFAGVDFNLLEVTWCYSNSVLLSESDYNGLIRHLQSTLVEDLPLCCRLLFLHLYRSTVVDAERRRSYLLKDNVLMLRKYYWGNFTEKAASSHGSKSACPQRRLKQSFLIFSMAYCSFLCACLYLWSDFS